MNSVVLSEFGPVALRSNGQVRKYIIRYSWRQPGIVLNLPLRVKSIIYIKFHYIVK